MNRRDLLGRSIAGAGLTGVGAYVFPWPKWMQMGDTPGHMFASWSGCKLRDVSQLPTDFIQRAESGYGHLLTVDRSPFARPLTG